MFLKTPIVKILGTLRRVSEQGKLVGHAKDDCRRLKISCFQASSIKLLESVPGLKMKLGCKFDSVDVMHCN